MGHPVKIFVIIIVVVIIIIIIIIFVTVIITNTTTIIIIIVVIVIIITIPNFSPINITIPITVIIGPIKPTGNPTRLRKSYNLFQYIIMRETEQDPSVPKHTSKTIS